MFKVKHLLTATLVLAAVLALGWGVYKITSAGNAEPRFDFGGPTQSPDPGAQQCKTCHAREVDAWHDSQHARAMRLLDDGDVERFSAQTPLTHGPFTTSATRKGADLRFVQTDGEGKSSTHTVLAVIAVEPLIQYLAAFPGGRLQCVDAAYDVDQKEWFHVFGDDVRDAGDWGFWKNRSLNWNSRCAACHMTNFRKRYDVESDSYDSTWDAMGISCAQCHGDLSEHMAAPDDAARRKSLKDLNLVQTIDVCMSCHARREDLTGEFKPGERFEDHYRMSLLTDPGLYYADGQIRDEVFEATSFASSAMFDKGVTCLHCHNPHSGKTILPVEDNQLCMTCHVAPGWNQAPVITPLAHSHHAAGSPGNQCVNCHMATTDYMVRDPRRDHGFTIPDPQLTIEHNIPNACNRCHTDRSAQWALAHCDTWYGERMQRSTRARARVVARAQSGDAGTVPALIALAGREANAVWKASLLSLLDSMGADEATPLFMASLNDASPLVLSIAIRALAPRLQDRTPLAALRQHPTRLVRLEAASATLGSFERGSDAYRELKAYLGIDVDQPSGAFKQAQLALAERRTSDVDPWLEKMLAWDPSAGSYQLIGRILHALGRLEEAVSALKNATALAPDDASGHYTLALLQAEAGRPAEARAALQRSVKCNPSFGRAWYNLGLALAEERAFEDAIQALRQAEVLLLSSPDPAYAIATIHVTLNQPAAAREAALRALQRQADHGPSRNILRNTEPNALLNKQ